MPLVFGKVADQGVVTHDGQEGYLAHLNRHRRLDLGHNGCQHSKPYISAV